MTARKSTSLCRTVSLLWGVRFTPIFCRSAQPGWTPSIPPPSQEPQCGTGQRLLGVWAWPVRGSDTPNRPSHLEVEAFCSGMCPFCRLKRDTASTPQPWPNPLRAAALRHSTFRVCVVVSSWAPVSILGSRALTQLWQMEAVSAMAVSHLAPPCGLIYLAPTTPYSRPSPPPRQLHICLSPRSQELSRVCEILQPRAPPLAGVGGCFMVPPAGASTPGHPGSRLSHTCP